MSWPNQAGEALARQRLEAKAPPAHAHAKRLLTERRIQVTRIIDVQPDAILYLGRHGQPMTAWLEHTPDQGLVISYEPGFPAEPSPHLARWVSAPGEQHNHPA